MEILDGGVVSGWCQILSYVIYGREDEAVEYRGISVRMKNDGHRRVHR